MVALRVLVLDVGIMVIEEGVMEIPVEVTVKAVGVM